MRVVVALLGVGVVVGACDPRLPAASSTPAPAVVPAAAPTRSPAAEPPPVSTPTAVPTAGRTARPPCDRPELWLALYARDQLSKAYCKVCQDAGGACDSLTRAGASRMDWQPLHADDQHTAIRYACNELAYVALAIGAFHGQPIEDPYWKPYFTAQSWYRPDPAFDPARLPAAARSNRRWIEGLRDACLKTTPPVSASDWQVVSDWFAARAAGKPPLPTKLYLDGEPATPEAFLGFVQGEGLYRFDRRTPVIYGESLLGSGLVGGDRTLLVPTGDPGISCLGLGEECEGFEWLEMRLDAGGRIVALGVSAAACPFVYAASGSEPLRFRGEILRNLRRADLAATQTLALASVDCRATVRVRLSEEKPETSYVDHLALLVDGVSVLPDACLRTSAAYCEPDGIAEVLRQGEQLELSFTVPPDSRCRDVRLEASGYYLPGA